MDTELLKETIDKFWDDWEAPSNKSYSEPLSKAICQTFRPAVDSNKILSAINKWREKYGISFQLNDIPDIPSSSNLINELKLSIASHINEGRGGE